MAGILDLYSEKAIPDSAVLREGYSKLDHPDLGDQLRPYIENRAYHWLVRRGAFEMAEACGRSDLQDALLKVALDPHEMTVAREQAADAFLAVCDEGRAPQLCPLLEAEPDEDDQLKGLALRGLWPQYLSADEVFERLSAPKNPHLVGNYWAFLFGELPGSLPAQALDSALRWLARIAKESTWGRVYSEEKLVEQLIVRAWNELEPQLAADSVGSLIVDLGPDGYRSAGYRDGLRGLLASDQEKRRLLLSRLVPELKDEARKRLLLWFGQTVMSEDLSWILDTVVAAEPELVPVWECYLRSAFDRDDEDARAQLASAGRLHPQLAGIASELLAPRERHPPEVALPQPPARRNVAPVAELAAGVTASNPDAWLAVADCLRPCARLSLDSDLAGAPAFQTLSPQEQAAVLDACAIYLQHHRLDLSWWGTNRIPIWANEGLRAIRLLATLSPDRLWAVPRSSLIQWIPALMLGYARLRDELQSGLVRAFHERFPDETRKRLVEAVRMEPDGAVGYLRICWDDTLADELLGVLKANELGARGRAEVARELLDHGHEPTSRFLTQLATDPARKWTALLALAVSVHHWDDAWQAVCADEKLSKEFVSELVQHSDNKSKLLLRRLHPRQLADLLVEVWELFPPKEDGIPPGVHVVGLREKIGEFRDFAKNQLSGIGSREAAQQMKRLADHFRGNLTLRWNARDALATALVRQWSPPSPPELARFLEEATRRFVRSSRELHRLLLESLARYQKYLRGPNDAITELWDERAQRPKQEERLSSAVARFLERDLQGSGIVVNREVQIRKGQKTDIHVDVVQPGGERLSSIVEVKGCYHRELWTAMGSQLVGRYLKDHPATSAIYLVGWYDCEVWSGSTPVDGGHLTREEAADRLASQANGLCQGDLQVSAVVLDCRYPLPTRKKGASTGSPAE